MSTMKETHLDKMYRGLSGFEYRKGQSDKPRRLSTKRRTGRRASSRANLGSTREESQRMAAKIPKWSIIHPSSTWRG